MVTRILEKGGRTFPRSAPDWMPALFAGYGNRFNVVLGRACSELFTSPTIGTLAGAGIIIAILAEICLEYWFLCQSQQLARYVLLHIVLSVVMAGAGIHAYAKGERRPLFFILMLSFAALGAFGAAGAALAACCRKLFALGATPFNEWYDALFPPAKPDRVQVVYENITLRGSAPDPHCTVIPFIDVFAGGTIDDKRKALSFIADFFDPSYVDALKAALRDGDAAIRVQAATTVARIESVYASRAESAALDLQQYPQTFEGLRRAGQYAYDYADSGILDASRALRYREQALEYFDRALAIDPADAATANGSAALLLKLNRAEEAVARLRPFVESDAASSEMVSTYAEALYCMSAYEALRELNAKHASSSWAGDKAGVQTGSTGLWIPLTALAAVEVAR